MDQQVPNKQEQPVVEDLTVTEEEADEVKAGHTVPYYLKLQGVDGDITS